MKILLLDTSHLPTIGGKEIVVHHLAHQYQALGHKVRVAGPGAFWTHRNTKLSYPIDRYPSLPLLSFENQWAVRVNLILNLREYDVIHAHTTHPCSYHAQRHIERRSLTTPLVVTPHGEDIHKVPEIGFGKRLNPDLDDKIRWVLQRCTRATAISQSIHASLRDAGAPEEKIIDIRNGVDAERFSSLVDIDTRKHLGLDPETKLIVSIGNHHPRKGHAYLIDALARCKNLNTHLVIIGHQTSELSPLVTEANLTNRVTLAGPMAFPITGVTDGADMLAALLQQCLAYVSASTSEGTEGLSLALLEAMSAEACPIATSVSGNRDMIVDGTNGYLVSPKSAEQLAAAIDDACDNPKHARAMGTKARATIECLSWETIAHQYLNLFQELLTHGDMTTQ